MRIINLKIPLNDIAVMRLDPESPDIIDDLVDAIEDLQARMEDLQWRIEDLEESIKDIRGMMDKIWELMGGGGAGTGEESSGKDKENGD